MKTAVKAFLFVATSCLSMATAVATPPDLQNIADHLAIEQLYARLVYALNTFDSDAYPAMFADDADLVIPGQEFKGRERIRAFILGYIASYGANRSPPDSHGRRFSAVQDVVTSLKLDVKGSSASAEAYWLEVMTTGNAGNGQGPGSPLSLLSMGRSEDELVKRNGKWLISKRVIIADMVPPGVQRAPVPAKK